MLKQMGLDVGVENRDGWDVRRCLLEAAACDPQRPALVDNSPRPSFAAARSYTFGEFAATVNRLAHRLVACGIGRGTRTVLLVPPSLEFFALCHALLWVGAVPIVIDPGIGSRAVRACLKDAQPDLYLGNWLGHAARLLLHWGGGGKRHVLAHGAALMDSTRLWSKPRQVANEDTPFPMTAVAPDDPAAILFTTGSTGLPKGALYTHGNLAAQVDLVKKTFDGRPGDVDLPTFPLFALLDPLLGIMAVVSDMRFPRPAGVDVAHLVETIRRYQVTHFFASPLLVERLTDYCQERGLGLPQVRRAITAGAPLSARVLGRFMQVLEGDKRVTQEASVLLTYGATEALPITTMDGRELLANTCEQTAEGAGVCIGRVVVGVTVSILVISDEPAPEWDSAHWLPPGVIGEIVVEGAMVSPAYVGQPETNARAKMWRSSPLDRQGCQPAEAGEMKLPRYLHRTGDLGYLDEQGRLWFCGRMAHRVVTKEATFYSEPCEGIFNAHPLVRRSALVGVQVAGVLEAALCVEPLPGRLPISQETLRNELLALGARRPQTQSIRRIFFHPHFPVDIRHNSKILREELAAWAQRQIGS